MAESADAATWSEWKPGDECPSGGGVCDCTDLGICEKEKPRYGTVVADPPWRYVDGFPSLVGPGRGKLKRATKPLPYAQMSVEEIAALPVSALAGDDAALFLWTTNRYLRDAFDVMDAWGFTYTQTLVWVKDRRSPFVASVAPNHTEYLLVGKRGAHRWSGSLRSNVVDIAAPNQWRLAGQKPEAFLDHVEAVSPGPYIELFSRRARLGWDTWGDQALHGTEAMTA